MIRYAQIASVGADGWRATSPQFVVFSDVPQVDLSSFPIKKNVRVVFDEHTKKRVTVHCFDMGDGHGVMGVIDLADFPGNPFGIPKAST